MNLFRDGRSLAACVLSAIVLSGSAVAAKPSVQLRVLGSHSTGIFGAGSGRNFPGDPNSFAAHAARAAILGKLDRTEEAVSALKTALPLGTVPELQQFGRQLITAKKPKLALEVFRFSDTKNPDQFPTLIGMAPGPIRDGRLRESLGVRQQGSPPLPQRREQKSRAGDDRQSEGG